MREGRVDGHAASFGSTPEPHERDDSIAQIEEALRIDAEVLEDLSQLTNSPSDAFAAVEDRLPRADLRGLDVLDIRCQSSRSTSEVALNASYPRRRRSTCSSDIACPVSADAGRRSTVPAISARS
jgi:hypothetical protein